MNAQEALPLKDKPDEFCAPHVGAKFQTRRDECRRAVLSGAHLHHVGHCTNGVFDFDVDVLAHPEVRPLSLPVPVEDLRNDLRHINRHLSFKSAQLDRELRKLCSGSLIRVVLQTDRGGLYCDSVVPGTDIVALTLRQAEPCAPDATLTRSDPIWVADRAVARLVTDIRRLLNIGSLNPGGFQGEDLEVDRQPAHPADVCVQGAGQDLALPLCRQALSPDDLHYVAYHRGSALAFSADVLEHDRLEEFFTQLSAEARRRFYQQFGREFGALAAELGRVARSAIGGPLTRLVLDVEQGALYYYRLPHGSHLVGVTLNQERVSQADTAIARLATACRDL